MVIVESRPDWISSSDAAERLGITPGRVRELIAAGALDAQLVGRRFLVSRASVEARAANGPSAGRPFSAQRAWALILLSSGVVPAGLDGVTLSKLRRVLRERDLWSIRLRLASRAERREMRAHSSDLPRIAAERDVVWTGARHAADVGIELVAPTAQVEAYVDAATADRLTRGYQLRPSDRPNVVLHVVPPEVRGWLTGRLAPPAAIALDLADDRDARSRDAARAYLMRARA